MRFLLLPILFLSIISVAPASESGTPDPQLVFRARTWFEWGEYDSLARYVPPLLRAVVDSADIAQLLLYLGVAHFAAGDLGQARADFDHALGFDQHLRLDEKYVSEEVISLFTATVEERAVREIEIAHQDSLMQAKQEQLEREAAIADSLEQLERDRLKVVRRWRVSGAVGSGIFACAFGALAVFEYREAEAAHERFVAAAENGDKAAYEHYRGLVRRGDALTVSAATMSILSAATSIVLAVDSRPAENGEPGTDRSQGMRYGMQIVLKF